MHTKWSKSGNVYTPVEVDNVDEQLSFGVYRITFNPIDGFQLLKLNDGFVFNQNKIYGLERSFIDRVKRTYPHMTGNLGVLLHGMKGGGKSFTCKILANELQLPILLVEENFGTGLTKFISRIQQNVLVLVDEYEKVYSNGNSHNEDDEGEKDSTLLTLMDGVLNSEYRRVFLLTTNKLTVNENLLDRPGRILYKKEFGNLKRETIEEIIDDMLIHKHLREKTIRFIAQLQIITIDIVAAMVREANIHEEDLELSYSFLNVTKNPIKYDVIQLKANKEVYVKYATELSQPLEDYSVGDMIGNDYRHFGEILEVVSPNTFIIKLEYSHSFKFSTEKEGKSGDKVTIKFEPVPVYHSSFGNANAF